MKVRGKNNSDWKTLEECENESMIGKKKWYDLIPIDKIKDGKAQAFNYWLREYIVNAMLPVIHLDYSETQDI